MFVHLLSYCVLILCWWSCWWQIFVVASRKYLQCHVLLKDYKIFVDVKLRQKQHSHSRILAIESGGDRENSAMSFIFNTSKSNVVLYCVHSLPQRSIPHTRCQVSSSWLNVAINCNDMVSSNHIQLHCDFIQSIFSLYICVYFRFCVCIPVHSHNSRSLLYLYV